jgi:hypothetical protein
VSGQKLNLENRVVSNSEMRDFLQDQEILQIDAEIAKPGTRPEGVGLSTAKRVRRKRTISG